MLRKLQTADFELKSVRRFCSNSSSCGKEDHANQQERQPSREIVNNQASASDGDDEKAGRWNSQLAWLNNLLESASRLYKRTVPPEDASQVARPATARSLVDIAVNLHRSTTTGMQQWSLGDLTFGLYLLSLHHASEMAVDTIKGEQVTCPYTVEDFIYNVELAKGAYMRNAAALARVSMLRESNVVKFVEKASVMRPAYYIALDNRQKLVILGIRGTSSIPDIITDLVSHGDEEVSFDGGTVHFGTAKAAEWFLLHELRTLQHCLETNTGFGLRLIGHSLGASTASVLAMMIRKKSKEELGFCPGLVSAVGFATPPCVSKIISTWSADFISTIVLQDDVISRLSATSLVRLRNEILGLDWATFLRKGGEDRKGVSDLVASTVQALSSVQDVARRYKAYASRLSSSNGQDKDQTIAKEHILKDKETAPNEPVMVNKPVELFVPGSLYHIHGHPVSQKECMKATAFREGCTLWKGYRHETFQRIVLSGTFFADHKCDSYYQALRDTLKGLPLENK